MIIELQFGFHSFLRKSGGWSDKQNSIYLKPILGNLALTCCCFRCLKQTFDWHHQLSALTEFKLSPNYFIV